MVSLFSYFVSDIAASSCTFLSLLPYVRVEAEFPSSLSDQLRDGMTCFLSPRHSFFPSLPMAEKGISSFGVRRRSLTCFFPLCSLVVRFSTFPIVSSIRAPEFSFLEYSSSLSKRGCPFPPPPSLRRCGNHSFFPSLFFFLLAHCRSRQPFSSLEADRD